MSRIPLIYIRIFAMDEFTTGFSLQGCQIPLDRWPRQVLRKANTRSSVAGMVSSHANFKKKGRFFLCRDLNLSIVVGCFSFNLSSVTTSGLVESNGTLVQSPLRWNLINVFSLAIEKVSISSVLSLLQTLIYA